MKHTTTLGILLVGLAQSLVGGITYSKDKKELKKNCAQSYGQNKLIAQVHGSKNCKNYKKQGNCEHRRDSKELPRRYSLDQQR